MDARAAQDAREGIETFILPFLDVEKEAMWRETLSLLTPAPAGKAIGVPLNHEVVEVPSSEQVQAVLDRVDEMAKIATCPHCGRDLQGLLHQAVDCTRCHNCLRAIPDGRPRVFTTAPRVYCLDCGKNA